MRFNPKSFVLCLATAALAIGSAPADAAEGTCVKCKAKKLSRGNGPKSGLSKADWDLILDGPVTLELTNAGEPVRTLVLGPDEEAAAWVETWDLAADGDLRLRITLEHRPVATLDFADLDGVGAAIAFTKSGDAGKSEIVASWGALTTDGFVLFHDRFLDTYENWKEASGYLPLEAFDDGLSGCAKSDDLESPWHNQGHMTEAKRSDDLESPWHNQGHMTEAKRSDDLESPWHNQGHMTEAKRSDDLESPWHNQGHMTEARRVVDGARPNADMMSVARSTSCEVFYMWHTKIDNVAKEWERLNRSGAQCFDTTDGADAARVVSGPTPNADMATVTRAPQCEVFYIWHKKIDNAAKEWEHLSRLGEQCFDATADDEAVRVISGVTPNRDMGKLAASAECELFDLWHTKIDNVATEWELLSLIGEQCFDATANDEATRVISGTTPNSDMGKVAPSATCEQLYQWHTKIDNVATEWERLNAVGEQCANGSCPPIRIAVKFKAGADLAGTVK